jgi:hypothetical protein
MAEQKKKRQSIADMKRELQAMQIASRRRQEGKQATGESVAKELKAAGSGQSSKPSDKSKYVSPSGKQYAGPGYSAGEAPKPKPKPQAAAPAPKPKPKPKPQAAASAPKPKPEAKPQMSSLFDRRKMTSATSNLFIGPRAAAAQRGYREEDKPKRRRRGQGSRR